jgi:LL-diaminopimelate aminotransferase
MQVSRRVAAIPPYFFAGLGKRIADLRARGVDVIRMDMGAPDLPPAEFIIDALVEAARRPTAHSYSAFGGSARFREAAAEFYRRSFGVSLDPGSEVLGLIGSKEGLFHLVQAVLNPGDVALIPDPGYPVYASATQIAGGEVVWMPLTAQNGYLADLEGVPADARKRARLAVLNYPNNPTGAIAPREYFESAVSAARSDGFLLVHDAAYTHVGFDGYQAPSLMQIEGAREVSVEFHTLSKTYNMAGWRLGIAVGQRRAIEALYTLKSQVDTSHFEAVQEAGVAALTGDQTWIAERNEVYRERRDMVLDAVRRAGLEADTPKAGLYVWARIPGGQGSAEFCDRLLDATGVSVTPGVAFGRQGEGYVRLSLGTATPRLREAMERLTSWAREASPPQAKAAS